MRKFCLLLILSLALPVFCLLQAVEPPKKEIRAVWLTTVYGLDWPHKPATTEAGRKAQQQALLDILDRLQEANFNMVFIQARLRGDVMYRRLSNQSVRHSPVSMENYRDMIRSLLSLMNAINGEWNVMRGS